METDDVDTMKDAGATGWMLSFASAAAEHRTCRLREDYRAVEAEGGVLAMKRHSGVALTPQESRRLDELGRRLTWIVDQMGGASASVLSAAERLGLLRAPACDCNRCVQERAMLGSALVSYWGLDLPRSSWSSPRSGSL